MEIEKHHLEYIEDLITAGENGEVLKLIEKIKNESAVNEDFIVEGYVTRYYVNGEPCDFFDYEWENAVNCIWNYFLDGGNKVVMQKTKMSLNDYIENYEHVMEA